MSTKIEAHLNEFKRTLLNSLEGNKSYDVSLVANNLNYKLGRIHEERSFALENRSKFAKLTRRERQIFKLVINGFNNPQIAKELTISRLTVEQHRKNINKKLDISHLTELVKYGYAFNLI